MVTFPHSQKTDHGHYLLSLSPSAEEAGALSCGLTTPLLAGPLPLSSPSKEIFILWFVVLNSLEKCQKAIENALGHSRHDISDELVKELRMNRSPACRHTQRHFPKLHGV